MLKMTDESGPDAKILAVPIDKLCTSYRNIKNTKDMPTLLIDQIAHFFEHYKDLEENKWVKLEGWTGPEDAQQEILGSVKRFQDSPEKPCF